MFMPVINPNEHIYSLGARYHILSANQSHRQTSHDLMDNNRGIPSTKFGTGLHNLSRKFDIEIDYLIDNHTYFPIYKLFTDSSNYEEAKTALIAGDIQSLMRYLGLVSGEIFETNTIGYCRSCVEESEVLLLQNDHQIPGINICYKHGDLLQKKTVGFKVREYFNLYELLTSADSRPCLEREIHEIDQQIAAVAHNLINLSKSDSVLCYELMREKVLSKLMALKYVSSTGKVKQRKLHTDFVKHYSKEYLIHAKSMFNNHEDTWLSKFLIGKSKRIHPIRGIMLILLFSGIYRNFVIISVFQRIHLITILDRV